MLEWLLTSIDSSRGHNISGAIAWHARMMFVAWAFIVPLAIVIARFFKITPKQNWPTELDNQFWWRTHWIGQTFAVLLTIAAVLLARHSQQQGTELHTTLGYSVFALACFQVAFGVARGSKGGPTAPLANGSLLGHHYRMSRWRRAFEFTHKSLGYSLLLLSVLTILTGMWSVNAPNWIWLVCVIWWILLCCWFVQLQRQGKAWDTYQAIWGPDKEHPGNRQRTPGWGTRKQGDRFM